MTDAPERTHYADDETLEYIRKLEQERNIFQGTVKGLVALREWCPENAFATHGNDAEWVCDCYACNERRDALCEVERLRDIISPGDAAAYEEGMAAKEATIERLRAAIVGRPCECVDYKWDATGVTAPRRCWRCQALTKPEGE